MNITIDLFHIVEQAHSLTRILDAAERAFSKVLERVLRYPQVFEGLAMVADRRGEPERAISLYERELAATGSEFSAYRLAALWYDAKRYDRAYEYSSRIWEKFENAAILHAQICIALKKFDEAERTLLSNIDKDFAVEDTEYLLAMLYLMQGRPEAQRILDTYENDPKFDRLRQLQRRLERH